MATRHPFSPLRSRGKRGLALLLLLALPCMDFELGKGPTATVDIPRSPDAQLASLKVPPGFTVERVAGYPLVDHPMMGAFDERGRLFLAESAGRNLKFADLLKELPNRIRLLEGLDDARPLKSTVFVDHLTFPMGVLWYDGALYTAAAPSLWRFRDRAGVAVQRQALVSGFTSTGNGADIHGPFLGPDGWLYWTKGRHAHEIHRPDGTVLKGTAARIFRCRPDGWDLETVCGGGMDDPVEIAFTPEGEPLATVDIFLSRPQRVDAIFFGIEGGVFPHAPNVLAEFKRTGDLLPAVAELGWVAPAGLMRYRGTAFGEAYRDNLFSAQFNTHKIQRHILERAGAGFRARSEDFLVSSDPDFHPTDVLEDADGSLLVIDTGGWFRIGCPTSQIAKPDIKGAIYRVRRQGARSIADPRGLAIPWEKQTGRELVALLDDPRFMVRDRAVQQLAHHPEAVGDLQRAVASAPSVRTRRNAVWAATRLDTPAARAVARAALADRDVSVRIAAAHTVGLLRDAEAQARLEDLVIHDTPAVRRQAATALGRLGRAAAVPALLRSLGRGSDRFLEHALIYALIRIADRDATLAGLRDPNPAVRRAALIALDQMDGGRLTAAQVVPLLNTADPALRKTVLAILTARPAWGQEVVPLLGEWLRQDASTQERRVAIRDAVLAFSHNQAVQDLVAQALHREQTTTGMRRLLLEAMAQAPLDKLPPNWITELGRSLDCPEAAVVYQAVSTIRSARVSGFADQLLRLARDRHRPANVRVAAFTAACQGKGSGPTAAPPVDAALLEFLLGRLHKDLPPLDRLAAAEALGSARLEDSQLEKLAAVLPQAGSLELPRLLAAFENSRSATVGAKLVAALAHSPALPSLTPDLLHRTLHAYPATVRRAAEPLERQLRGDAAKEKARLTELAPVLSGGNAARGRKVFFGTRATCSACHTIAGEGGRVGPDLSKIGAIRTGRDLLEAIVFPSASFVRGYEPYVVTTNDGRLQTGILGRETPEAVYLITAERAEVRIPRSAIDTIERGRVSIMPQGLETQLSRQELADLIAYLQSLR